jgi:hypothetical protein
MRKAEDVVDLREVGVLLAHLAVDRVERLLASRDLHLQLVLREGLLHVGAAHARRCRAGAAGALHGLVQRRVAPRVQVLEAQVLQLAVGLVQAQPVRDRRVDVQRLARDALALARAPSPASCACCAGGRRA